jgi:hypothetical protein
MQAPSTLSTSIESRLVGRRLLRGEQRAIHVDRLVARAPQRQTARATPMRDAQRGADARRHVTLLALALASLIAPVSVSATAGVGGAQVGVQRRAPLDAAPRCGAARADEPRRQQLAHDVRSRPTRAQSSA